ncbi:MAG: hypothetical protein C5B55_12615 [Blastocatellia bacterium]|nr:MAG: hypothetical protein C5B55_12615 [Blastocatellia bacterium]
MKNTIRSLVILSALLFLPLTSASAQSCNPAAVDYIVRDEMGQILNNEELNTIHRTLPKTIGNADTSVDEVSFASDGVTYYWPESVEANAGTKVPVLGFVNAGTCTMNLNRVDLTYHGKTMSLIFNIIIDRDQDDRRPVIDSLPFHDGTFVLDLSGWSRNRDQMIPATRWISKTEKQR